MSTYYVPFIWLPYIIVPWRNIIFIEILSLLSLYYLYRDTVLLCRSRNWGPEKLSNLPRSHNAKGQGWNLYPKFLALGFLIILFYNLTPGTHLSSPSLLPPTLVQTLESLTFAFFKAFSFIFLLLTFPSSHQADLLKHIYLIPLYNVSWLPLPVTQVQPLAKYKQPHSTLSVFSLSFPSMILSHQMSSLGNPFSKTSYFLLQSHLFTYLSFHPRFELRRQETCLVQLGHFHWGWQKIHAHICYNADSLIVQINRISWWGVISKDHCIFTNWLYM